MLPSRNIQFNVIAIAEIRTTKNISVTQNIESSNYSFEHTPTESFAGCSLLYVADHLSYKTRSDLNIYKKFESGSTFIEIMTPQKYSFWHHLQTPKSGCDCILQYITYNKFNKIF